MIRMHRESERPRCPFCEEPFARPPKADPRHDGDFYIWVCSCGAIAAYDVTGHNLGDALMEVIAFACEDDWDKALSMEPEKDYKVRYIDCYHPQDHRVLGGSRTYKTGLAAFVFVKLKAPKHAH